MLSVLAPFWRSESAPAAYIHVKTLRNPVIDESVFRGTVMPFVEFKKHKHGKTHRTNPGLHGNPVNRLNIQIYL